MLRALLLDFDGTLVDSVPALREVYADFLRARGVVPSDGEFETLNGPSLPVVVERLRAAHGLDEPFDDLLAEYRTRVAASYRGRAPAMPGASRLLRVARRHGLRAAVVTSCPADLASASLSRLGLLDWLWAVVDASGVKRGKPAGDIYRLGLAICEVDAPEALAVEDAPHGMAAARAAGVRVIDAAVGLDAVADEVESACRGRSFVFWPGRVGTVVRRGAVEAPAEACEAVWRAAVARRPGLFDGPVDFLRRWTPAGLELARGSYRHFLAARADAHVAEALPGPPMAVSGVVSSADGRLLLGRRADAVTQYPGHWELVPAGGLGGESDGEVDWGGALLDELREEAGLYCHAAGPELGVVFDTRDPVVDLCAVLAVRGTPAVSEEYPTLAWHPPETLREPLVPTSAALAAVVHRDAWLRPALPADLPSLLLFRNLPGSIAVSNRPRALTIDELPDPCDPAVRIWMIDMPRSLAGQVTVHLTPVPTLGLALDPEHRGRGLATWAITEACRRLAAEGFTEVTAHIFAGNTASQKAFSRAGFAPEARETLPDGRVRETWKRRA